MLSNFLSKHRLTLYCMIVSALFLTVAGSGFAQSLDLEIDAADFISSINIWLALAVSVVVIGVGIRGAFALAKYVGDMIVNAFEGRR